MSDKNENISEGKRDEVVGRAKKAAGEITGNDELKHEGSIDKAKGKTKQALDKAGTKAKEAVDKAAESSKGD